MILPKHLFEMTEAELIRELREHELTVRELDIKLMRGDIEPRELFTLNRSDIQARQIRNELDARICAACV